MVSAPATYWMSGQVSPASASAARAAARPYSTKLRPHLPPGCDGFPRRSCLAPQSSRRAAAHGSLPAPLAVRDGLPQPGDVFGLVVLVEGACGQLDLHADGQV